MLRLQGRIQNYDWGSTTALADFVGLAPDGRPWAEIWYGAHPGAPALVSSASPWAPAVGDESSASAEELLGATPLDQWIGKHAAETFGGIAGDGRLPYLVKLLAAGRPLSLQAHPNSAQAQAGFAAEIAAGVPRAESNYADDRHKPESLFALVPTRALAGFRQPSDISADLARLAPEALSAVIDALTAPIEADAIRDGFSSLLRLGDVQIQDALASLSQFERVVVPAGAALGQTSADATDRASTAWGADALSVAREILDYYPGDRGVLATIFLHAIELAPGQALSVGAGVVHCYLSGLGLEVMANSDNVLRAGLTSKRVDVSELLSILDFTPSDAVVDTPVPESAGANKVLTYPPHFSEYAVTLYELAADEPVDVRPDAGPRVILGLGGRSTISSDQGRMTLGPGDGAFATDGERLSLHGCGTVAVVRVP